ncbi:hypothetical protein [Nitrosomonas aestuarii]|nr:hypothetical protein [Nitrosomonas aestuarii]
MEIFKYVIDVKMMSREELRKEILENLCRGQEIHLLKKEEK